MAEILKGAPVAAAINDKMREKASRLRSSGVIPTLAIVRVGANDADIYYERGAMKRCGAVGVDVRNFIFPEDVSEDVLVSAIEEINVDTTIHGVLIFRPLPSHISDGRVRGTLAPEKDVDGITDGSLVCVFTGNGQGFRPCTAEACTEILDHYCIDCTGKRAVVLGRSLVIGKPVAQLLLGRNATVTTCHTRTKDLASETSRADIIIAAVGHINSLRPEHVSGGQIVIDVGINTGADGKMCGDVDFAGVEPIVGAITPVPGGVGAVTTSVLVKHVVEAAERAVRS